MVIWTRFYTESERRRFSPEEAEKLQTQLESRVPKMSRLEAAVASFKRAKEDLAKYPTGLAAIAAHKEAERELARAQRSR